MIKDICVTTNVFLGGEKLENISIKEIMRSGEEKRILTRKYNRY